MSQSSFLKREVDVTGLVNLLTHIEMRNVDTRYNSRPLPKNWCPPVIHTIEKLVNYLLAYF